MLLNLNYVQGKVGIRVMVLNSNGKIVVASSSSLHPYVAPPVLVV